MVNESVTPMGAADERDDGHDRDARLRDRRLLQADPDEQARDRQQARRQAEPLRGRLERCRQGQPELRPVRQARNGPDRRGHDEFKLSYRIMWLLDKGMFATSDVLDECEDRSMQTVAHSPLLTPVVVGIDCGRKNDRTVVTVLYVDWNRPDAFGFYHHRVLNWLDLTGVEREEQYFRIVEFLSNYRVWRSGIDTNGMGGPVGQRLRLLMPRCRDRGPGLGAKRAERQMEVPEATHRQKADHLACRGKGPPDQDIQVIPAADGRPADPVQGPVRPRRGPPRKGRP